MNLLIIDSLYVERVVLRIETADFVPDNSELTLLLRQLQQAMRSGNYALYITHIWSHTGLPSTLAQKSDQLQKSYKPTIFMKNINF